MRSRVCASPLNNASARRRRRDSISWDGWRDGVSLRPPLGESSPDTTPSAASPSPLIDKWELGSRRPSALVPGAPAMTAPCAPSGPVIFWTARLIKSSRVSRVGPALNNSPMISSQIKLRAPLVGAAPRLFSRQIRIRWSRTPGRVPESDGASRAAISARISSENWLAIRWATVRSPAERRRNSANSRPFERTTVSTRSSKVRPASSTEFQGRFPCVRKY